MFFVRLVKNQLRKILTKLADKKADFSWTIPAFMASSKNSFKYSWPISTIKCWIPLFRNFANPGRMSPRFRSKRFTLTPWFCKISITLWASKEPEIIFVWSVNKIQFYWPTTGGALSLSKYKIAIKSTKMPDWLIILICKVVCFDFIAWDAEGTNVTQVKDKHFCEVF